MENTVSLGSEKLWSSSNITVVVSTSQAVKATAATTHIATGLNMDLNVFISLQINFNTKDKTASTSQ